jgi:uracil-DNA glycosylase
MNVKRKATSSLATAVASPTAKKLKQDSLTAFFGAPKVNKDIHTAPKIAFDKTAWLKTLSSSQKELLKYNNHERVQEYSDA